MLEQVDGVGHVKIAQPVRLHRLGEIVPAIAMIEGAGRCIESAAARSKQGVVHAVGLILDNLEHGVLKIGVEPAADRKMQGTTTGQGIEIHGFTGRQFFRQVMQMKADEVADLLAFHINNANRFPLPDHAGRALGCRHMHVSFVSHGVVLLVVLCT